MSTVKLCLSLRERATRQALGLCFAEGFRAVRAAETAGADVEMLVVAGDLVRGPDGHDLVGRMRARGVEVREVGARAFARISSRDGPAGIAAVVRVRAARLRDLRVPRDGVFLCAEGIANPGNLGSVLRAADGAGCDGVVLAACTTDPFHPDAVRASMGAVFGLPIATTGSLDEVFGWARARAVASVTTSARARTRLADVRIPLPCAIVIGSERHGLDAAALRRGDVQVSIPMRGVASSLNVSVAAGILLYQATEARGAARRHPSSFARGDFRARARS